MTRHTCAPDLLTLTAQYSHSVHVPDRAALRREFDAAVAQLEQRRDTPRLTTPFYAAVGNSVFDTGYAALHDFVEYYTPFSPQHRDHLHVVSAPVGSGKTSFSYALVAALVRYSDRHPQAPFGGLMVFHQIEKADDAFKELNALLPGRVAIWTSDHDRTQPKGEKVKDPAALFTRDDLRDYPVAIITHAFLRGPNSHKARHVLRSRKAGPATLQPRALTVIDEQIDDVIVRDITLSDVEAVYATVWDDPQSARTIGPHMNVLREFMRQHGDRGPNLEKPTADWKAVADQLTFFTSEAAADYVHHRPGNLAIENVFAFARALARGYAFITRPTVKQATAHFIGYESHLIIEPGTVQLDATADIDGVLPLCPWRVPHPVPKARYDNLHVVSVPPLLPKGQRISNYLKLPKNRRAYANWMEDTIKAHMAPGQRGLVICKKDLIEQEALPSPQWDVGGRKLDVAHWGTGIGSNAWQDAEVVFLFDEFFIPYGVSIGTAQGLLGANAWQGPLRTMKGYTSRHTAVDGLWEGHLLRWLKQMALRGHARQFDGNGICGKQKLVLSADRTRLLSNMDRLFPGAKVELIDPPTADRSAPHAQAMLSLLSQAGASTVITTAYISKQLGKPWRTITQHIRPDEWRSIEALGWRYVPVTGRPRKGQLGSRFERIPPTPSVPPMPPIRTPAEVLQSAMALGRLAPTGGRPSVALTALGRAAPATRPANPWDF